MNDFTRVSMKVRFLNTVHLYRNKNQLYTDLPKNTSKTNWKHCSSPVCLHYQSTVGNIPTAVLIRSLFVHKQGNNMTVRQTARETSATHRIHIDGGTAK